MINLLNFIEQVFFYFVINGEEFLGSISTYIHEMLAQSLFVTYCAVPNMDFQHYKNIIYLLNKKGISSSDLKDIYISVGLFDAKSQELFIEFMFLNPRSAYDEYFKALVAYCEYGQGSRSEYLLYTKQQLHAIWDVRSFNKIPKNEANMSNRFLYDYLFRIRKFNHNEQEFIFRSFLEYLIKNRGLSKEEAMRWVAIEFRV